MSSGRFPPVAAAPCCADCRHFFNAPEALERRIAGFRVMGSAYGAARAEDGLCALHDRYLSADYCCAGFAARRDGLRSDDHLDAHAAPPGAIRST